MDQNHDDDNDDDDDDDDYDVDNGADDDDDYHDFSYLSASSNLVLDVKNSLWLKFVHVE